MRAPAQALQSEGREAPLPLRVGYWSDPLCIWALLGEQQLLALTAAFPGRIEIGLHLVPVFGSVLQRFRDGAWAAGGVEGRVEATRALAARFGRPEISGAGWRHVPASTWGPSAAVVAARLAEADGLGPPGGALAYLLALRSAFFLDDRNIALRIVQQEVAVAVGQPWPALAERLDDGRAYASLWEDHLLRERLGIQGSPTFVFDSGRTMLYGNFDPSVLRATVDTLLRGAEGGGSAC